MCVFYYAVRRWFLRLRVEFSSNPGLGVTCQQYPNKRQHLKQMLHCAEIHTKVNLSYRYSALNYYMSVDEFLPDWLSFDQSC